MKWTGPCAFFAYILNGTYELEALDGNPFSGLVSDSRIKRYNFSRICKKDDVHLNEDVKNSSRKAAVILQNDNAPNPSIVINPRMIYDTNPSTDQPIISNILD